MNIALWLERAGLSHGNLPAVGRGSRVVQDYKALAGRAARLATALRDRIGLGPGDRVVIAARNCPEYLEVLYAIWHAGLVAVPANAKLHGAELGFILEHSGARVCFVSDQLEGAIAPHAPPTLDRLIIIGGADYESLSPQKRWLADENNAERRAGAPADVIEGMDLFVGLSGPRALPAEALARMAPDAMVFAMSNPTPEVTPEEASAYARVIATGRSDYPNQINNVLCFPGIFRGALDVRARHITEPMKMAAARGIAAIVGDDELSESYVIPSPFNRDVAPAVADAVAQVARSTGAASSEGAEFGYAQGDTTGFRAIQP